MDDDKNSKRQHISTGNTPHKPAQKKTRPWSSSPACRKSLSFSPNQASQNVPKRVRRLSSPLKQLRFSPNPAKKQATSWHRRELRALIEYIALFSENVRDVSSVEWPCFGEKHPYWNEMAEYIKKTAESSSIRSGNAVRKQTYALKKRYDTLEQAEEEFGLSVDGYLEGSEKTESKGAPVGRKLSAEIVERIKRMNLLEVEDAVLEGIHRLKGLSDTIISSLSKEVERKKLINGLVVQMDEDEKKLLLDELYLHVAQSVRIDSNPAGFGTLSINAMRRLQNVGKNNLVLKYCQCIAIDRPDGSGTLMPLLRMPFGLVEYCIEFFTCTNTKYYISVPRDYELWHETMTTEFPGRFHKLFAGPMWSGLDQGDIKNPLKARTNVPCTSKMTQSRKNKKSLFDSSTNVQVALLDELKESNPKGRFWVKLDATDVKEALMESQRGEWNGDVDLGNSELLNLRATYDERLQAAEHNGKTSTAPDLVQQLRQCLDALDEDIKFLSDGLQDAIEQYRKKFTAQNTPEETLKAANWDVVEYQTLLEQSQSFKVAYTQHLGCLNPACVNWDIFQRCRLAVKDLIPSFKLYLRNLFKKKRTAANHVLVIMVADEQRKTKPYALPVKYIPCRTLKDQFVRDLTREVKIQMKDRNLLTVGTATDGEFCSLRTRGESRALHVWQLIHDARVAVQKMTVNTLLAMLVAVQVRPDGSAAVQTPNPAIPQSIVVEIHNLRTGGMSLEDAITYVRGKLVPAGYTPFPFRRNAPSESFREKLQSIVGTYLFRHRVEEMKQEGADFTTHLYVPEVDSVSGVERHDRADHNHVFKRMAKHVRDGGYEQLYYEAFDDVLKDNQSGLTHAALIGKRKQSLQDAERLLSYHVVDSLRRHGHHREASHVEVMVHWHDATDGRGLSQLQRCRYNYQMLDYILEEWMPWHKDCYDFSTIDINRPVENIRGFSRETVIEVTSNIESQELRRLQNGDIGYVEHPRAGGTDDMETFYCITHRDLGDNFTLKQFKNYWPNNVREFTKRIDSSLPFYYFTLNERFRDDDFPSFDECLEIDDDDDDVDIRNHPIRLQRLRINQREDSSIFVCARALLPTRHKKTIRQAFHKPEDYLPNPNA